MITAGRDKAITKDFVWRENGDETLGEPVLVHKDRIEALKLAYEVAFRTESLRRSQQPEERREILKEVFELANYNEKFISTGVVDIEEYRDPETDSTG